MKLSRQPIGETLAERIVCNHLCVIDGNLYVLGNVITSAECMDLPWRRKKDGEPASKNEVGRDIELVLALFVRGAKQGPEAFSSTKCFIREDVG